MVSLLFIYSCIYNSQCPLCLPVFLCFYLWCAFFLKKCLYYSSVCLLLLPTNIPANVFICLHIWRIFSFWIEFQVEDVFFHCSKKCHFIVFCLPSILLRGKLSALFLLLVDSTVSLFFGCFQCFLLLTLVHSNFTVICMSFFISTFLKVLELLDFMSFISLEKFLVCSLEISLLPHFFCSPFMIPIMYILVLYMLSFLSQFCLLLLFLLFSSCIFLPVCFLCVGLDHYYWPIFSLLVLFCSPVPSVVKYMCVFFFQFSLFFSSSISFIFLQIPVSW